jgi:hypothetical protein
MTWKVPHLGTSDKHVRVLFIPGCNVHNIFWTK